jgi:hypothetical protein
LVYCKLFIDKVSLLIGDWLLRLRSPVGDWLLRLRSPVGDWLLRLRSQLCIYTKVELLTPHAFAAWRGRHTRMAFCPLPIRCDCFAILLIGNRLHCWEQSLNIHITYYNST